MLFTIDFRHIFFLFLFIAMPTSLWGDKTTQLNVVGKCEYESKHEFPLAKAVQMSNIQAVKCLIAKGYDANLKFPKTSILTIAVVSSPPSPQIVKLLLENGAKPENNKDTLSDTLEDIMLISILSMKYGADLSASYSPKENGEGFISSYFFDHLLDVCFRRPNYPREGPKFIDRAIKYTKNKI